MADNIRSTINVIDYSQKQNEDRLLMTLDVEKAFHVVIWPFIIEVLNVSCV